MHDRTLLGGPSCPVGSKRYGTVDTHYWQDHSYISILYMANISKPSRHEIRALQLCRQVQQGVEDFLWCDCCDPLLDELQTLEVTPLDGGSGYLAIIESPETEPQKLLEIETRLKEARGSIRASVGAVINRKRVPQLRFHVISRGE